MNDWKEIFLTIVDFHLLWENPQSLSESLSYDHEQVTYDNKTIGTGALNIEIWCFSTLTYNFQSGLRYLMKTMCYLQNIKRIATSIQRQIARKKKKTSCRMLLSIVDSNFNKYWQTDGIFSQTNVAIYYCFMKEHAGTQWEETSDSCSSLFMCHKGLLILDIIIKHFSLL